VASRSLKHLSRVAPDWAEIHGILDGISDHTDREVAIVSAALLDHGLECAIKANLIDLTKVDGDRLFGDRAPMNTLSAKIILARAMSLISQRLQKDLDTVRDIRNTFSHALGNVSFYSAEIANACDNLKIPDERQDEIKNYHHIGLSTSDGNVPGYGEKDMLLVSSNNSIVTAIRHPSIDGPKGRYIWSVKLIWMFLAAEAAWPKAKFKPDKDGGI